MIRVENTKFEPHPHLMGVNNITQAHVVKEPEPEPEPVEAKVVTPRRGRPPKSAGVAETK